MIKAGADYDSVDLSEQWVLDCSKGDHQCKGVGTPRYAVFMKQQGVLMHEDDYPYTKAKNPKICPDGPYWSPGYKIDDFIWTSGPKVNTDESLMMKIMEHGSILMSVIVGKGFGSFKSGVYDIEYRQVFIMNYRFLTTETNSKALYIFRCLFTTSSVKLFVVNVQIFVYHCVFRKKKK